MGEAFILVVEGDRSDSDALFTALEGDGHRCVLAAGNLEAWEHLRAAHYDVILWDAQTVQLSERDALASHGQAAREAALIVLRSTEGPAWLEEAVRGGVVDCLGKPLDALACRCAVARALERQQLRRENIHLRSALARAAPPGSGTGGVTHFQANDWPTLQILELRYLDAVLARTRGNRTVAAGILGVDRRTVQRLIARRSRA